MSRTRQYALRRWLIGGAGIALLVIGVLSFGITQIIKAQEVAQAQKALQGSPTTGITQIDLAHFAFFAPNIQITTGTTVTWTNQDSVAHNVTFDQGGIVSGILNQGQSFSYTFTTPGIYTYHCTFHPEMLGKITVTP